VAQWYIGEERAVMLLRFAEAELSKYAYSVPSENYSAVRNVLRTQIPMWVEERRGPVDTNGVPLYSYKGYLYFIKWWIAKLLFPEGRNEMTVKAGWINEIFDPARRVFGKRKLGAAIDVAVPGADALLDPELNIGPYYAKLLYLHGLEALYKHTEALRQEVASNPNAKSLLDAFMKEMDAWLSSMTNSWQNELLTPTDPAHPEYRIGLQQGTGVMDKLYKAIDDIVYYNTRQQLFGVSPTEEYGKYNVSPMKFSYGQGSLTGLANSGYEAYMPDPNVTTKTGAPGFKSFAALMRSRGIDLELIGELIRAGKSYSEATRMVNEAIQSVKSEFTVGANDAVDANSEALFQSELQAVKMALGL
jgi:hypothetical protein